MRYKREEGDGGSQKSAEITKKLLLAFPDKKWVIDAGSLQVLDPNWIPPMAILTPNKKEYEMIFGKIDPAIASKKYNCIIVRKGPTGFVYSPEDCIEVRGGNPGLTKGGGGDVEAGLTVALLAKNEPLLAATASLYITKKAADTLFKEVGTAYNSDDLAGRVPSCIYRK
jgi:NAD(P)H-hydrate epimerase